MDKSCKQSKIGRTLMWSEWLDSLFYNHFQKQENTKCFPAFERAWILGEFITRTC